MNPALLVVAALVAALGSSAAAYWHRRWRHTENARRAAAEQLDRKLAELYSIQELAYLLSESLEPERITAQVTGYVQRFLEVDGVALVLVGATDAELAVSTATGSLAHLTGTSVPDDDSGLLLEAIGTERVQLDLEPVPESRPLFGERRFDGTLVAPMRAHGVTIGAIAVVEPKRRTFAKEDVRLLSAVATHTAVVLANARFFELIRRGNDDWESVFEALSVGLALVDRTGCIHRANRALAEMARRPVPALVGEELTEVLPQPAGLLRKVLDAALAGDQSKPLLAHGDAEKRVYRLSAAAATKGLGAVVLVEDVTEQDALQTELIQSEKLAAVGQLVSGVAHELNNPLTSIAGLAELLLEQPDTPARARMHLEVVQEQAERAGRIVQNLLTFARKGPPQRRPINLNSIARRTMQLMAREFETNGVELTPRLTQEIPDVLADEHQPLQVAANLLTNALQAMREVPRDELRRVVVETAHTEQEVRLSVRDTGPGLPDEVGDRIFTPFFTTKEPGHGTGLGLSISYRSIDTHNGTLTASREDGETVFTVILPGLSHDAPAGEASLAGGLSPRVLVIDDDAAARRLASAFFVQDGYDVDARAAAEGLDAATREMYDVILVDTRAASPDGASVLDTLLARPGMSARLIAAADAERPRSDPHTDVPCVAKPFNLKELGAAVRRVWGGSNPEASGPVAD